MTIDASQFLPASTVEAPAYEDEEVEETEAAVWDLLSVETAQGVAQKEPETPTSAEPEVLDLNPAELTAHGDRYTGASTRAVLLEWAADVIPAVLYPRFEQQIAYVEQNVNQGVDGLQLSKSGAEISLKWDVSKVPSEPEDFRRWVFGLTNKPVVERTEATKEEFQLRLVVEGRKPAVKAKKSYNVGEGQFAFNF